MDIIELDDSPVCVVLTSTSGMRYFVVLTEISEKHIRGPFFIRSYDGNWNYGQGRGLFWWAEIASLKVVDRLPC